eukprot:Nk52_evm34s163 gene=Nk52_evmTU34s163
MEITDKENSMNGIHLEIEQEKFSIYPFDCSPHTGKVKLVYEPESGRKKEDGYLMTAVVEFQKEVVAPVVPGTTGPSSTVTTPFIDYINYTVDSGGFGFFGALRAMFFREAKLIDWMMQTIMQEIRALTHKDQKFLSLEDVSWFGISAEPSSNLNGDRDTDVGSKKPRLLSQTEWQIVKKTLQTVAGTKSGTKSLSDTGSLEEVVALRDRLQTLSTYTDQKFEEKTGFELHSMSDESSSRKYPYKIKKSGGTSFWLSKYEACVHELFTNPPFKVNGKFVRREFFQRNSEESQGRAKWIIPISLYYIDKMVKETSKYPNHALVEKFTNENTIKQYYISESSVILRYE